MKKILLMALSAMVTLNILAQSETEKKYFSQTYNDTFKNESIVIYRYLKESQISKIGINDYKINVVIRVQYKLNDIAALNAFSTMTKKNDLKRYELKQVKTNGKVNVIYEYFDKKYPDDGYPPDELEEKKKKNENIPLEDLEIGDIIDYKLEYTYTTKIEDPRMVKASNGKFEDEFIKVPNHNQYRFLPFVNEYLNESYPVVSKLLVYDAPSELKLIQRGFNTNFKFEETKKSDMVHYECLSTLIPSYVSEDFSYNIKYNPMLRHAFVQTNTSKLPFYPYQFESVDVSKEEIVALGRKLFRDKKYMSHLLAYTKVSDLPEYQYSQKDIFQDLELSAFFKAFVSTFCKKNKNKYESLNKMHEYLTNNDELNTFRYSDMAYAVILGRFCKHLGLKFELMATLPRYEGEWNQILSPYDITWGLFVPRAEGDLYISTYLEKSNIYQLNNYLATTEVIKFDPLKDLPYQTVQYPEIKPQDNTYYTHTSATLTSEKEFDYEIVNNYKLSGSHKYNISDLISGQFNTPRLRTAGFKGLVSLENEKVYNFKEFDSNEEFWEEYMRVDSCWGLYFDQFYTAQMTRFLYNDYDFRDIVIDSLVKQNDGDFTDDDTSIYNFRTHFKSEGLIDDSESDSFKVVNLGNMITRQYHLSNYYKINRQCDVFNTYRRNFVYEVELELPKGFKPVNLEDFNIDFENEAGIFSAKAVLEDGKIVLKVKKVYKFLYLPKDKWSLVVDFLQTAEKFYLKKLIIIQ